jgi:hypothetical protein
MAGLGAGNAASVVAGIVGVATVRLWGADLPLVVAYAGVNALPTIILSFLALRARRGGDGKLYWYPEGFLLTAIALYPCFVFMVFLMSFAGRETGLLDLTAQVIKLGFAPMAEGMEPSVAKQFKAMIDMLPRVFPALVGCSWIFLIIASMLAAQMSLSQQKWNLRPAFDWMYMNIPVWLIGGAAITALAGALAPSPYDYIGGNLCAMLCLPFFFIGLAVVHIFAATTRTRYAVLIPVYVVMTLFPWAAVLVALLGVLDQFFRFRQRMSKHVHTQGEST